MNKHPFVYYQNGLCFSIEIKLSLGEYHSYKKNVKGNKIIIFINYH
jgi:hypothetical protein